MPATPLPRVLSAVAAALLVALMLASAGSASAAPSASSSATASCAKATKTVRTAKSRLRKAQALARRGKGSKNVSFVLADGTMGIVDGKSKPGDSVELRAEARVLAVVSNCPQIRNPCNGFNPTPIRVVVTDPVG